MKLFASTLAAGILAATASTAATIDLSDESFSSVTYQSFVGAPNTGPIIAFSESVSGVTFDFASSASFRGIGAWGDGGFDPANAVLQFGGSGGSVSVFTLIASQDVTLTSFTGLGQLFNTNPLFDVMGPGVDSVDNTFSVEGFLGTNAPATEMFQGGALNISAGEMYTFSATNSGPATTGYLTGFDFEVAAVPLPAGLPLLLAGLGAFGVMRRRQKA